MSTRAAGVHRAHEAVSTAVGGVRTALAENAAGPGWPTFCADALGRLAGALEEHGATAEAPGGLLPALEELEPRSAAALERLRSEHRSLPADLRGLAAELEAGTLSPEAARRQALELLYRLDEHRQRISDLVLDTFGVGVGA